MKLAWLIVVVFALAAGACGSDSTAGSDAAAGSSGGGATGSAGTTGGGGNTGAAGRGGTTGSAGTTGAGGTGTQPIGAACANTANCSQADGTAVCCLSIPACVLANDCPASPNYIPCDDTTNPCMKAGWICCNTSSMRFCTKQNGCPAP